VFLRPVVVRDGAATEALSLGRYEQMRLNQMGFQPAANGALPVPGSAVLPPLTAGDSPSPSPSSSSSAPAPAKP
jgi:general secretion pathway protein D